MSRFLHAIFEPVLGKVTAIISSLYVFLQSTVETGVFRLFDIAIALGIMGIVAFFVWKEYQKERTRGNDQDEEIKNLLIKVTDALNNSTQANKQSAIAIEQNSRMMEQMIRKVERIETHVKNG